jgi:hypothetical protein
MPPDFRSQGFRYEVMTEAALILYRDRCQNLIGERMRREYFIFRSANTGGRCRPLRREFAKGANEIAVRGPALPAASTNHNSQNIKS